MGFRLCLKAIAIRYKTSLGDRGASSICALGKVRSVVLSRHVQIILTVNFAKAKNHRENKLHYFNRVTLKTMTTLGHRRGNEARMII